MESPDNGRAADASLPTTLTVVGESMQFLLDPGDRVLVRWGPAAEIRAGEIVVVLRWPSGGDPQYVLHRLLGRFRAFGKPFILTKGDNRLLPDAPMEEGALRGRIVAVWREESWRPLSADWRGRRGIVSTLLFRLARPLFPASRRDAALRRMKDRFWDPLPGAPATDGEEAPRAAARSIAIGRLDRDESWSGDVVLAGDVVVPAGVTLRVAAGTRVRAADKVLWSRAKESARGEDARAVLPSGACSLVVEGRLLVEGAPQSRVRFGGAAWGGLHFLGAAQGALADADVEDSVCGGVNVRDRARVELTRAALRRNQDGLRLSGGGRAALTDCAVRDNLGHGARAAGGELAASGGEFSGNKEVGLLVEDGGRASLGACVVDANRFGVGVRRGTATLERVSITNSAECGLDLQAGEHELSAVRISGGALGLAFSGTTLAARSLEISACATGLSARAGAVAWTGGAALDCGVGLEARREARVALDGVRISGSESHGARVSGGALSAASCEFTRCGEVGVLVEEDGRARLRDCVVDGNRFGVGAPRGTCALERVRIANSSDCALDLQAGAHELEAVKIAGAALGLAFSGTTLAARSLEIAACGVGLSARAGSVVWTSGSLRDCGLGLEVRRGARAALDGVKTSDSKSHGVRVRGGAFSASNGEISGSAETGLLLEEDGRADLSDCALRGNRCGVDVRGGTAELERVSVAGGEFGLALSGKSLALRGLDVADCGIGVSARAGDVTWTGGALRDCGLGLEVRREARAALEGVKASASKSVGVRVSGGAFSASNGEISGSAEAGLLLDEDGRARLSDCALDGGRCGVDVRGGTAELERVRVADCGIGVSARAGDVSWTGGALRGCGLGVEVRREARVALEGVATSDSKSHGARVRGGEFSASNGAISGSGEVALLVEEDGRARLSDCVVDGNRFGVGVRQGACALARVTISNSTDCGLDLQEGAHELDAVRIAGGPLGLSFSGKTLAARALELAGCEVGLSARAGVVTWSGGAALDCGVGVEVRGAARVALDGVTTSRSRGHGARVRGGELTAARCAISGGKEAALLVEEDGRASLCDCVVDGNRYGVGVRRGTTRLERVSLSNTADCALDFQAGAHELQDVRISGASLGVSFSGRTLAARALELAQCGVGLSARAGSVAWSAGAVRDCGLGIEVLAGASVALVDVETSGSADHGLRVAGGELAASRCAIAASRESGLRVEADGRASLSDCAFDGGACGVDAPRGTARLERVTIANASDRALDLQEGAHELQDVRISGSAVGLVFSGRRLSAHALDFAACGIGLSARAGSVAWTGGAARDCGVGLEVRRGARVALDAVKISGSAAHGARAAGGELAASRCEFSGSKDVGLLVEENGRASLSDCAFDGNRFGLGVRAGTSALERVRISNSAECAVDLQEGEHQAREVRLEASAVGLVFSGKSLSLRSLEIADCGVGVSARAGRIEWTGGAARGCGVGVEVRRGARVALDAATVSGSASHGVRVAGGELSAAGLAVRASGDVGLLVEDDGRASLVDCVLDGNRFGVGVRRGTAALARVRLLNSTECGLDLQDGEHDLEAVSIAGGPLGLAFSGKRLAARALEIAGCALGASARAGTLEWTGGFLRDCGLGLEVRRGARAALDGVKATGSAGHGVRVSGGDFSASRCEISGSRDVGLLVEDGSASLAECRFDGNRFGVGVRRGTTRLEDVAVLNSAEIGVDFESGSHSCRDLRVSGSPVLLYRSPNATVAGRIPPERARDVDAPPHALVLLVRRAVIATGDWPGLGGLYRALYALGGGLLALWAKSDARVRSLWAHRGWAEGRLAPGLSDIDWACAVDGLAGEAGASWLRDFGRRHARAKRLLPFLGEPLLAEPADFAVYLRRGGSRAREFRQDGRLLAGVPLSDAGAAAAPPSLLDRRHERAHAYTSLIRWSLWEASAPWPVVRYQADKAALDLLRYAPPAGGRDESPLSRRDCARAIEADAASPWKTLRRRLLAAADAEAGAPVLHALCAQAALHLHDEADDARAAARPADDERLRWLAPSSGTADDSDEKRRRGAQLDVSRARLGEALGGACWDDLYRSYYLVEDGAARHPALEAMFAALALLRREKGQPNTLPILLTRRAWRTWRTLSYLEAPLDFSAPRAPVLVGAGRAFPHSHRFSWGLDDPAPATLDAGTARDAARRSLANFRVSWRFFGVGASPLAADYVVHFAHSRVMGLRLLLERGVAASFFALDPLREAYAREFPEEAAPLEALWAATGAIGPRTFFDHYAWLDAQLRRVDVDFDGGL